MNIDRRRAANVDDLDLKISRRMKRIMSRVEKIVMHEIGEELGIAIVIFPFTRDGEESRIAEYQYVSNTPRAYTHDAFKSLVQKWDAGHADIPPHIKS